MLKAATHATRKKGVDDSHADDATTMALLRVLKSHPRDFPGDAYLCAVARGIVGELLKKMRPKGAIDTETEANPGAGEDATVGYIDDKRSAARADARKDTAIEGEAATTEPMANPKLQGALLDDFEAFAAQYIDHARQHPDDSLTAALASVLDLARVAVAARDEGTLQRMVVPGTSRKTATSTNNAERIQSALLSPHRHFLPDRAAGSALETIARLYPELEGVVQYRKSGSQMGANARYKLRAWTAKKPAPGRAVEKTRWRESYSEAAVRIALSELSDAKTANAVLGHARTPRSREKKESAKRMADALAVMGMKPGPSKGPTRRGTPKSNK